MKKKIVLLLVLAVLVLSVWRLIAQSGVAAPEEGTTIPTHQTDPEETEAETVTDPTESVLQTEAGSDPTAPTDEDPAEDARDQNGSDSKVEAATKPATTEPVKPTAPAQTEPERKPAEETKPKPTQPKETVPPETKPKESTPPETKPKETTPPETKPKPTDPPATEPKVTEPTVTEITYEFKRQVASYAAQYINQYRGSACTVLPGMSQVAQYRASQLTRNYNHSTADKRAALAKYEYGRYIDATEFGDDASNSYWEADSAEAICAGFYGTDPKAMGKKIADLIRNSGSHWSYIGSSEYSYIGVGVEYREGTEYGWYACVMVGSVNYG